MEHDAGTASQEESNVGLVDVRIIGLSRQYIKGLRAGKHAIPTLYMF